MSIFNIFQRNKKSQYFISDGKTLLKTHSKLIGEIRSVVGVPKAHWQSLYLKTLINLAAYIQELPASELHHHSGRGGLLTHTLEVTINALRIRLGKLLPPNADAETVIKYKDLWTYAVFSAALGHDLGKPITDVFIPLVNKKGDAIGNWSPFSGPMNTNKLAYEYLIHYRRNRIYASHERASALYIQHIIPVIGLEWLASNQDVFYYWTNLMTGHHEDGGIIGSIIHEADKQSVASNLAGDQTTTGTASQTSRKPLHQRILTSLRYQLEEGLLPLNRDGAAGWIVDDKLWVVVKRVLDQIRDHMTEQGQTGIPARNDRIMDELQQYHLLIPCGDKAVWKCQVFSPKWTKAHELTLLCLPVERIWPSADAIPEPFQGTVTPLGSDNTTNDSKNNEPQQSPSPLSEAISDKPIATNSDTTDKPPTIDFNALASLTEPAIESEPAVVDDNYPTIEQPDSKPIVGNQPDQPLAVNDRQPVSGTNIKAAVDREDNNQANTEEASAGGTAFLNWLRDNLHLKKMQVNGVNAKIHITKEGLFMVSPAIFKQFDQDKWSYTQKRFTKLKLHERNSSGKNIHEYMASGKKKRARLNGFLITDTANVFPGIELPGVNQNLEYVERS